jgi:UDP-2-acetamido-2-deoxy-ribo-hexuluronate aminotransferase
MAIAFIDLQAQRRTIADKINTAVLNVIESGHYIMGPQVAEFERNLAAFSNAKFATACANGTDALVLALRALNVGPGDAVFCPAFTFTATAEAAVLVGATPVFVDIDPQTYNISVEHLSAAIDATKAEGTLTPKVIIGVCLFGQAADYPALRQLADQHGLKLIADSAQGFGTTINGQHPSDWADLVTTSFFPAKPLGCYGDGGALLTNDAILADTLDSIRVHGKATKRDLGDKTFDHDPKYLNMRIGTNSRLDTLQAAILLEKLALFANEIVARNTVAARYSAALSGHVASVPFVKDGYVSTWAQYTIEHDNRDGLAKHLKDQGIPSAVYYPISLHQQPAYKHFPTGPQGMAVTTEKTGRVISLPMHPYLSEADQDAVIAAVVSFAG